MKKYLMFLCIAMMLFCMTACGSQGANVSEDIEDVSSDEAVIVLAGERLDNNENWKKFKQNSVARTPDKITIINDFDGEIFKTTVEYDGKSYTYTDSEKSVKRKYLLDVTGTQVISADETRENRLVVLANEEYTFDELNKSIYSSNSNDLLDFEILFWE